MKISGSKEWMVVSVVVLLHMPLTVHAANKALLIGTTSYANEQNNLPGIELDIAEMERVARKLGFSSGNIKILKDKDVTLGNIRYQFESFLTQDMAPNDTVMIYYSGHGVQIPDKNGDELDGYDEAVSLYDLTGVFDNTGEGTVVWDGVLLDDQFADLLDNLVSDNVFVIVDACHSGTVTRSYTETTPAQTLAYGAETFAVKSLGPPRVATRSLVTAGGSVVDERVSGVITLSAAQDDQKALASSKGSLFTLAVAESLEGQRGTASPQSLLAAATELLDERLDDDLVYQPNLSGDEALFGKSIVLTDAAERGEVNQADLMLLASEVSPLTVETSQKRYLSEERIQIVVDVPTTGYLNIVAVDSNDEIVVLFPNSLNSDNQVFSGEQGFPGELGFEWAAQPPWGNTMLTVLFSQVPFSLFDSSLQRTVSGEALADYVMPSLAGFQDFRNADGSKAAGVVFVKTCRSSEVCN